MPEPQRPTVVLCSPYVRAHQTAEIVLETAGIDVDTFNKDERLREKEFGILDRLTTRGIAQKYPELYEQRQHVGKFYFRPPGGESWCDVILRLRSLLDTVALHYAGRRALVVTHQVVLLCLRFLLERLSEEEILAIDCQGDIANCGVTEYRFDPMLGRLGGMRLLRYNFVTPVKKTGTPVTAEPRAEAEVR
jgi:broad specificity phosphatase PhoE